MNTEKLIAKGVEKHFDGQKVLFKIESLKEHFSGLLIYESDIVSIEEEDYVIAGDVNFDNATANDVAPKVEEELYEDSEEGTKGIVPRSLPEEDVDVLIAEANKDFVAEIEVIDEEVVEAIPTEKFEEPTE